MNTNDSPTLLTIRGTLVPKTLDAAKAVHNDTAGSPQGIAAARALGDLSHKVYKPVAKAGGSEDGELMFLDYWQTPQGIGQFFSNANVQEQAGKMFSKRDAAIWMRAAGAFSFDLPAAIGSHDRWLGIVRGPVKSPEAAIEAFRSLQAGLVDARRRGQLSHSIYFRIPMPGEKFPPEMFGLDIWCDAEGMQEHYKELKGLDGAFAGKPAMSVWEQAGPGWSEW